MAKIVNTDNFGSDHPNERFVENLPVLTEAQAKVVCGAINSTQGDNAPRYFKVVADDYKLDRPQVVDTNLAVITLRDDGDDEVRVKCTFGTEADPEAGTNEDSAAHRTAVAMLVHAVGGVAEHGDE